MGKIHNFGLALPPTSSSLLWVLVVSKFLAATSKAAVSSAIFAVWLALDDLDELESCSTWRCKGEH